MLAGEPPFTGPNAQAIIAKRFSMTPTPVRVVRPDVPVGVEAALARALARAPADRFASASEFASALSTGAAQQSSTTTVAVPLLRDATAEGSRVLATDDADPDLEPLRDSPEFRALVAPRD